MIPLHQIPNILTIVRIILIIPFAWSVFYQHYVQALVLFFVAGVSDGVDGFLARQFNWKSRFGAIADPIADKLLLMTAYIMLGLTQMLPLWLVFLVIGRDLVIVAGALTYHYFISHYDIKPSWWGKTCTLVQILYVLALIMQLAGLPMLTEVVDSGIWLVAFVTLASGIHYIGVWGYKGFRQLQDDKAG